jgi:hypothetical protein
MSEAQRKQAEQAQQEAKLSAEKFEKVFQATEPKVPQAPTGRQPEDIPHREIPVKNLERKTIAPETGKPQTLRDVIRRRYGGKQRVRVVRQSVSVKQSRGAPVYPKGRPFESSGRISTELSPAKAERLALVRERVRAVQNRRELSTLEKLYRRFRAQYPHDPELRP